MKIKLLLFIFCFCYLNSGYTQSKDSTFFFRADLSVTNNGFSIIPAFTLGDPAGFLDMKMGNKRFSFEPQFRYALEGRPWSFVFIYRYKAIAKPKFNLTFGGHLPGLNYITRTVDVNGIQEPLSIARRFLAFEIIPTINLQIKPVLVFIICEDMVSRSTAPRCLTFYPCRVVLLKLNLPENRISVLIHKLIILRWMRTMVFM